MRATTTATLTLIATTAVMVVVLAAAAEAEAEASAQLQQSQPQPQPLPQTNNNDNSSPVELLQYVQMTNSTGATTITASAAATRIAELEQQDPAFAYYRNSSDACMNSASFFAEKTSSDPSTIECSMTYQTAFDDYCGAGPTFHAEKCEIAKNDMEAYQVLQDGARLLSSFEYGDGSPYFAPDGTVNPPPQWPPSSSSSSSSSSLLPTPEKEKPFILGGGR